LGRAQKSLGTKPKFWELTYLFGLHIKSLINLQIVSATFGIGAIAPFVPPLATRLARGPTQPQPLNDRIIIHLLKKISTQNYYQI